MCLCVRLLLEIFRQIENVYLEWSGTELNARKSILNNEEKASSSEGCVLWWFCSVWLFRTPLKFGVEKMRIGDTTKIIGIANLKIISAGACLTFLWRALLMGLQPHTWSFPLQSGL